MAKSIVILGGTGKQGGSVVNAFLKDPNFQVRAVTRDPNSKAAVELRKKGVEVVKGDATDAAALTAAFKGANYIYAMTPDIGVNAASIIARGNVDSVVKEAYRLELEAGKNIIHAANQTVDTLDVLIFSALSAAKKLSNHAYELIYHFDAKAELVDLIESEYPKLAEKTAVVQLGMFATNWNMPTPLKPTEPTAATRLACRARLAAPIPFIDPNHDPALFVKALASQTLPPPIPGAKLRKFAGYAKMTTFAEWTRLLNDSLPVEVYFEEMSMDDWAQRVTVIPGLGRELAEMWHYCETVGYFGGDKGGTRIITELQLEGEPTKMEDFVKSQDWSVIYGT